MIIVFVINNYNKLQIIDIITIGINVLSIYKH